MKIIKILALLLILFSQTTFGANVKITEMTEDTAPTTDDLTVTVNSPGGTPASRKTTLENLTKGLNVSNVTTGTLPVAHGGTGATALTDLITLGTHTTGGYAASVSEGGAATTATALAANGANCSAGSYPLGVDASGAAESCTDATTEIAAYAQPLDSDLTTYAGITPSANIQSLLGSADYSAARTNLGLAIGTNVQAYDADLTTYAGITPSANVQTFLGYADFAAMKAGLSIDDLITLSGVADGATHLGTFTGTTITDSSDIKEALQELETGLEAVSGGGAPTDADYLVGTANGSLSAEIVVGTSPGGELGGTWGSPTIDDNLTVTGWVLGTSSATTFTSGTVNVDLMDGVGAVDMDYGSADITDHTFVSDGGTVILDGNINSSTLTASEIVITDGSKNLVSAAVATYPSLTELTYVKGVTSAIQTQLNAKAPLVSPSFTTPTLGVASATSINKVAITAPATSATLTIADGKTLTATNTVNLNTMTDGKWCKYTASGTVLNCDQDAPGGSITGTDTHVTFFDGANSPAGDAGFTYNKTTDSATLAGDLTVATEAYDATGWNGDLTVPTKDAVRDKIETLSAGSGTTEVNLPIYSAKITGTFALDGDASQGAQIDAGDGNWRLLFDATIDEGAVWQGIVPENFASAGSLVVQYTMASATTLEVEFEGAIMCSTPGDSADVGTASFSAIAVASDTVPGTAGYPDTVSITLTDDSCAAGDTYWVYLSTDSDDATNDDATGDREVIGVRWNYA